MVTYTCDRCHKNFHQKCKFNKHISRKIPCEINENKIENNNDNYCNVCNKYFSRHDALKRHKNTQFHKLLKDKITIKNNAKTKYGNINQVIGDKNIVINNNYQFILPFGNEETDTLTPEEKLAIFASDTNPIVMIIIKTNLNPLTPQYHNVGYKNMNLGWGFIYNGETWEKKEIEAIMNDLLNSKRKDLINIYNEIKEYLSEEQNKNIETKIDDIGNTVEPRLEHQVRSKKRLVLNLKTKFSDNRHLVIEAIKKSNKPIIDKYNTKTHNIDLKEGYTMEDVIRKMNHKKELSKKINIKKELAKDLLQKIEGIKDNRGNEFCSIHNTIDKTTDINYLNIIIRLLNKSYCFGNKINEKVIENEIKKEEEINKLLFG